MSAETTSETKDLIMSAATTSTSESLEELRGYLHKKTKTGKWQKRWFETNGCFLTYYKKQGQKLLAALNLPQVGNISFVEDDQEGPGLFTIELNERLYTVKAKDNAEALVWVKVYLVKFHQCNYSYLIDNLEINSSVQLTELNNYDGLKARQQGPPSSEEDNTKSNVDSIPKASTASIPSPNSNLASIQKNPKKSIKELELSEKQEDAKIEGGGPCAKCCIVQ